MRAYDKATFNPIEENLLKYVPKKLWPYVVWLTREPGEYARYIYFAIFEKDGKEYSIETADSVSELTWNCRQLYEEMEV